MNIQRNVVFALSAILLIVLIPFSLAAETKITVKGESFHNIVLRIINPSTGTVIKTLYGQTDLEGQVTFDYDTQLSELSFLVIVTLFGDKIMDKTFSDMSTDSEIVLDLLEKAEETSVEEPVTDESIEETTTETTELVPETTTEETETVTSESPKTTQITGFLISEGKPTKTAYLIAVIVVLLIVGLFIGARLQYRQNTVVLTQKPALTEQKTAMTLEEELKDAEERIKRAEEEIREIKSKRSEIEEAERAYQKAKENLTRLKSQQVRTSKRLEEAAKSATNSMQEISSNQAQQSNQQNTSSSKIDKNKSTQTNSVKEQTNNTNNTNKKINKI